MSKEYIERRIVTGFIISTEYIRQMFPVWDSSLAQTEEAAMLINWCLEYFRKYNKAPGRDIDGVYTDKIKSLPKAVAENIEGILQSLSDSYDPDSFNVDYLVTETKKFLQIQNLRKHNEQIEFELDNHNVIEAERLASGYTPIPTTAVEASMPFKMKAKDMRKVFESAGKPIMLLPGALGNMVNEHLIRSGFVAFMGATKIGKTSLLMEFVLRGLKARKNVALFQAGDMTDQQQKLRLAITLTGKSNKEKYCGELMVPITDCMLHQTDECDKRIREDFEDVPFPKLRNIDYSAMPFEQLKSAFEEHQEHIYCRNCDQWKRHGAVWFRRRKPITPLTYKEAYKTLRKTQKKYGSDRFVLSSHPNESLNVGEMKALLDIWEQQKGFVPDIIVIDYADILAPDPDYVRMQPRDQSNKTWQRLRALSEERHCLVITATQADAGSYDKKGLLTMSNFSEDRRKLDHVTAMWGLNQTRDQKRVGIIVLNELAIREGDSDPKNPVYVLQRLQMGKAFLGSFQCGNISYSED